MQSASHTPSSQCGRCRARRTEGESGVAVTAGRSRAQTGCRPARVPSAMDRPDGIHERRRDTPTLLHRRRRLPDPGRDADRQRGQGHQPGVLRHQLEAALNDRVGVARHADCIQRTGDCYGNRAINRWRRIHRVTYVC